MLRKFVESSNLISKQITIEYPHNLCVRPKVGNAICTSCKRTQISRNLAMQIAQNSRRYIASRARAVVPNHDNIYKLYCEFSTTTARGEREGKRKVGEWHRQSTVGAADLPLASHCALCNNNNDNNRITRHRTWYCMAALLASLSASLPGKSYANACV